jgi:hypothetical protein
VIVTTRNVNSESILGVPKDRCQAARDRRKTGKN